MYVFNPTMRGFHSLVPPCNPAAAQARPGSFDEADLGDLAQFLRGEVARDAFSPIPGIAF